MLNQKVSLELRARLTLERCDFRAAHSLGQNFILDESFLDTLLTAAGLEETDHVLEIGPGPGILTVLTAARAERVLSLEVDEKLRPVLDIMLEGCENAEVVFMDAMKADIATLVRERLGVPYRVIANLPYYITADVILRMLSVRPLPQSLCLMVQKEAADRMMSQPGDENWCALAAIINYYGSCRVLADVPPERFNPPPHVDSRFIRIDVREQRLMPENDDSAFVKLAKCCFHMRRKTLANNLKACYGLTQAETAKALEAAGLDARVRGEALTLEQIAQLCHILNDVRS